MKLPYVYYFEITQYQKRAVSESQNELVVIGPQEVFIEDIETNLSLLRHKIKHPDLKTIHYSIGKYTKTDVYVVYIEGLCKEEVLAEITILDFICGTSFSLCSYYNLSSSDYSIEPVDYDCFCKRGHSFLSAYRGNNY